MADHRNVAPATRDRLYQAMQTFLAGERVADALAATMDCFANQVAFVSADKADAKRLLEALHRDIWGAILLNWDEVKAASGETGIGHA